MQRPDALTRIGRFLAACVAGAVVVWLLYKIRAVLLIAEGRLEFLLSAPGPPVGARALPEPACVDDATGARGERRARASQDGLGCQAPTTAGLNDFND